MPDSRCARWTPADGPAIDALIREEAQTTSISMTTSYRYDVYRSLLAQHPSLFGVVAETPAGRPGRVRDRVRRRGHRGRTGLSDRASREPQGPRRPPPAGPRAPLWPRWRIAEAEQRFGGAGVLTAAIDSSNAASIATARRWASQIVGPVILRIARPSATPPPERGLVVRPLRDGDAEEVLAGDHNLPRRPRPRPGRLGQPSRRVACRHAAGRTDPPVPRRGRAGRLDRGRCRESASGSS